MSRICWVLWILCLGCAEAPPITEADPESLPEAAPLEASSGDPAPPAAPESYEDLRTAVAAQLAREDYEAALRSIDRALSAASTRAQHQELEGLKLEARRHLLQSTVADAFVLLDRDRTALGEPITGELILVNLSRTPLSIPASGGSAGSATTLQMEVDFLEFGTDGTVVTERLTWNLEVGQDLLLAPGERHAWPISLDTLAQNPGGITYRTYQVGAILYPAALRRGAENVPGNLRFRAKSCGVFPRNYEHLADDPRRRLREAVEKESPRHVPVAAALISPEEREAASSELLAVLRRRGDAPPSAPTRIACCVALRILTGEAIEADPAAWHAWAAARTKTP